MAQPGTHELLGKVFFVYDDLHQITGINWLIRALLPGVAASSLMAPGMPAPRPVKTYKDAGHTQELRAIASQRIIWGPSFEEVPGYSHAALFSNYHWTWYDQQSAGMTNWVLVANPSDAAGSVRSRS